MRVRISYGTEIEDVPEELQQLFRFVSEKTDTMCRQVRQIDEFITEEEIESSNIMIDKLRKTLSLIDQRLADIQSIGSGYVNYKQSEGVDNATEGRPSVDTAGDNSVGEDTEQPTGSTYSEEA